MKESKNKSIRSQNIANFSCPTLYNKNTIPKKCQHCKYRRGIDGEKAMTRSGLTMCWYMLDTGKMRKSYEENFCTKWEACDD